MTRHGFGSAHVRARGTAQGVRRAQHGQEGRFTTKTRRARRREASVATRGALFTSSSCSSCLRGEPAFSQTFKRRGRTYKALCDCPESDYCREVTRRRRGGPGVARRQPGLDCSRSWRARASTLSSISPEVVGLTGASTHWPFSSTWRKMATLTPSLRSWRPRI